jgi:hypothetical protein
LIPQSYLVPQRVFDHLTKRDQRGFHESDTNLSSSSSSECSYGSNASDELRQYKPKQQKRSKWELFYRELTDLAAKRNLNVRRM